MLRLKERKFSMTLKRNLIKILNIAHSYEFVPSIINHKQADLKIYTEICSIAKFGNFGLK